jgi:hypothetical protein
MRREQLAPASRIVGAPATLAVVMGAALLPALVFALALALFVRTGAPSLLTGDQAEHQMVAVILGVPHATGYPLFTLLNALAVRVLLPVDDLAHRVTLMTALWSALAVTACFAITQRLTGSRLAGLIAAATLATSNEFWSLSIIAEVYTLQALLVLAIWYALLRWWETAREAHWLFGAALLSGLATTHHGSFVPIVAPAILITAGIPVLARIVRRRLPAKLLWRTLAWSLLGLSPWLYLAAQFALFRPFDFYRGQGLPYHYYWGNPASWGDVVNLALGGGFRGAVFTHGWGQLWALSWQFARTLHSEVWWSGLALGALGAIALVFQHRRAAVFSAMVFVSAALFGINVAADIPKAHVYYLPAYVVWAAWCGVGAAWFARQVAYRWERVRGPTWSTTTMVERALPRRATLLVLLALPLLLGYHRFERLDRSRTSSARPFALSTLEAVAPNAVILCRWELCLPLQYLQLAEGRRLDVQLDQTEPEAGSNWADRAAIYLPQHPVYTMQTNKELAARYQLEPVAGSVELWRVSAPE